jgi:hypothetical protein
MVFQPSTAAFAASRLPPALPRGVARKGVAALLAIAALLLPGCDNPACVFGPGNCSGGGGIGLGENPATLPVDGTWIEVASPTITAVFPGSSAAADVHAPIVIFFSESMAPRNVGTTPPSGLGSVFQLQSQLGAMVPLPGAFLVGDGRVLVLFPLLF